MSDAPETSARRNAATITVSVDAMGGDQGPQAVVEGCARSIAKNPDLHILLHGDSATLDPLVARHASLHARISVRHSPDSVKMDDKPAQVMRNGRQTSMWHALGVQRTGDAQATVSCGNTGALMAVAMLQLRKMPGVHRPAIACLWPSRGTTGFNTMLDVGADVRADEESLLQYAMMGAAYYRNAFNMSRPRVGLLNVGTEDHKGRAEIKEAATLIAQAAEIGQFEFVGFVEGSDIPSDRVDVIVTDGFTGNVALKTGEGTARLISDLLRRELTAGPWSMFAGLLALGPMRRAKKRTNPSRVNGGVFLGLNGTVVKSHGSADATGVSSAIKLAFTLARSGFQDRMSDRLSAVMDSVADRQIDTVSQQDGANAEDTG